MTNEEKAQELSSKFGCYLSALEMANWKDQQYADEKKELLCLVNMLPMNDANQTIIEDLKGLLK